VEYRESITIINRILEEHKSTMVFAKPDLDWCDLAIQVCLHICPLPRVSGIMLLNVESDYLIAISCFTVYQSFAVIHLLNFFD